MEDALAKWHEQANRRRAWLFDEWLRELPEGSLRSHITWISQNHQDLPDETIDLCATVAIGKPINMSGFLVRDGRTEIIGPYVRPEYRRRGDGTAILERACCKALHSPDVHVLVPSDESWAADELEALGFHQVPPYLPEGAGDHRAFYANQAARAALSLQRNREPRGKGHWVVRLMNDDVTSVEAVVSILERVLDVNHMIAWEYAVLVHNSGQADIRFCRTERGARKLAERIMKLARMDDFPLTANVVRR